jgi:hypothetical protein
MSEQPYDHLSDSDPSLVSEKVLPPYRQAVKDVVSQMESHLDPLLQAKIASPNTIEHVAHVFALKNVDPIELEEPVFIEKTLLFMAMSSLQKKDQPLVNGHPEEHLISLLFERNYQRFQAGYYGLLVAHIYPEGWNVMGMNSGDPVAEFMALPEQERDQLEDQLLLWLKQEYANDVGIVETGLSIRKIDSLQKEIYEKLDIPSEQQAYIGAFTHKELGLIVLLHNDVSGNDMRHELYHLLPGLSVGSMGTALDEGITEHLALMAKASEFKDTTWHHIWMDRQADPFAVEEIRQLTYRQERRLLSVLTDNARNSLYPLFINRYTSGDKESVAQLSAALLNTYGFKGYLELYLAEPEITMDMSSLLLPTQRVLNASYIRKNDPTK